MEAWARAQPHLAGFGLGYRQRAGDAPIKIIGPLGPHAAPVSCPPALLPVLDDAGAIGWDGALSAARNQAFVAETHTRINEALTKAIDKAVGVRADKRPEWLDLMDQATAANRETPDTRDGSRPLDMCTKIAAFCEDVDLQRAYPGVALYLVKAGSRWAVGIALPLFGNHDKDTPKD
ncbi:hypothetical protein TW95_gp0406 [Pandoravirus inopinatum]|uniref:Uncharacterized protein n=1 Tax=Pandoravirus inopinatum TaxID=1605721 RepID=A0A0B5J601_9VIRU|nr:hypothetical protein TW95_gp0406 [Pandoravirus inopinatum]AJF97140.1 hypothetical protein [Pandoravirus inopinatum]